MARIARFKKLASLLLLLCFFLPLTKCEGKKEEPVSMQSAAPAHLAQHESSPMPRAAPTYVVGYDMAVGEAADVPLGSWHAIEFLLVLFGVFCVPALAVLIKEGWQSLLHVCVAVPSLYALYLWTFIGMPQYGGILAIGCWIVLVLLSAFTLHIQWRGRRKKRPAELAVSLPD